MRTYSNLLSNLFKVFCGYLLFSCSNKQVYEKVKLPEKGNYILFPVKPDSENYNHPLETFILNPESKKISILELKAGSNEININNENIFTENSFILKKNIFFYRKKRKRTSKIILLLTHHQK